MLKNYLMPNGHTYQYEEGQQPEEAVEVKALEPENKAKEPAAKKVRKPARRKAASK